MEQQRKGERRKKMLKMKGVNRNKERGWSEREREEKGHEKQNILVFCFCMFEC